jgi:lysozyme
MSETPRTGNMKGGWVAIAVTVICGFEGFQAVGWHDKIDPPGVNTVCYGHIENVEIGERHTKIECQEMLATDLPRYEAMVEKCIHVPMPDYRHAAIISFTYNVGGGALCKSSVARKLNAGDVQGGCDALLLYDKANGKVIKGLQTRRQSERKLCLRNDNAPPSSDSTPVRTAEASKVAKPTRPASVNEPTRAPARSVAVAKSEQSPAKVERHGLSKFWHEQILGW